MKTQKAHCVIDLDDVVAAGSVKAAIEQWAKDSDDTSSGVVGMEFSTSGPGSGWSRNHTADDFASAAFKGGALYYIDSSDGRLKIAVEAEEEEEGAEQDISGSYYVESDWSDESEVALKVPDATYVLDHPYEVAAMAKAALTTHSHHSDTLGWSELVRLVREAAEALVEVEID